MDFQRYSIFCLTIISDVLFGLMIFFAYKTRKDAKWLDWHKEFVNLTIISILLLILVVEFFARFGLSIYRPSFLFNIHLFCAVLSLAILILLRFVVTGEFIANKQAHRNLGYLCTVLYAITSITGMIMVFQPNEERPVSERPDVVRAFCYN